MTKVVQSCPLSHKPLADPWRWKDPSALALRQCPCAERLLDPWNADDIPEVVCWHVLMATARQWADGWWRRLGRSLAPTQFEFGFQIVPSTTEAERIEALRTQAVDSLTTFARESRFLDDWPFPFEGRLLGWVIRQWVQEPGNPTLAEMLSRDPAWQGTVAWIRRTLAQRPEIVHPDQEPDLDDELVLESDDHLDRIEPLKGEWPNPWSCRPDDVALRLRLRGLPTTPATIGYTYAVAAGEANESSLPADVRRLILRPWGEKPQPARGLVVTTLQYMGTAEALGRELVVLDEDSVAMVPINPEVRITGDLGLATGPLLERAQKVALEHQAFSRRRSQHAMTEIGAVRRAQRRAYQPEEEDVVLDYRAEALKRLGELTPVLKPRRRDPETLDAEIDSLLDSVYEVVSARLRRRNLKTTPPRNWRPKLKKEIRAFLNR